MVNQGENFMFLWNYGMVKVEKEEKDSGEIQLLKNPTWANEKYDVFLSLYLSLFLASLDSWASSL